MAFSEFNYQKIFCAPKIFTPPLMIYPPPLPKTSSPPPPLNFKKNSKFQNFETDFDEAKLILLIGCPSCHQTIKMMESTLLNQNPLTQTPEVHRQH